jgi:hypothetical protein
LCCLTYARQSCHSQTLMASPVFKLLPHPWKLRQRFGLY